MAQEQKQPIFEYHDESQSEKLARKSKESPFMIIDNVISLSKHSKCRADNAIARSGKAKCDLLNSNIRINIDNAGVYLDNNKKRSKVESGSHIVSRSRPLDLVGVGLSPPLDMAGTNNQMGSSMGCVRPLSLFYSDASADGVEERSLIPRSRSCAQLRRNATMSHAFSCAQLAFIDL
ncbi:hypothetical protein EVAR_57520_1 [Eumeta japonica]|uniref:Uncharacterized protein n=1 Tax=Eumeta variegata TaxID=151549 RepID=A0A4C1ZQI5_EUMVA|nr:hypothetical protein EVAR_57520_1 [Eumeta japonica]